MYVQHMAMNYFKTIELRKKGQSKNKRFIIQKRCMSQLTTVVLSPLLCGADLT